MIFTLVVCVHHNYKLWIKMGIYRDKCICCGYSLKAPGRIKWVYIETNAYVVGTLRKRLREVPATCIFGE